MADLYRRMAPARLGELHRTPPGGTPWTAGSFLKSASSGAASGALTSTTKLHNAGTLFAASGARASATSPATVVPAGDNPSQPNSAPGSPSRPVASTAALFSHRFARPTISSHHHLRTLQTTQHTHHQKLGRRSTCPARLLTAQRWAVSPSFPGVADVKRQRHPRCTSMTRMMTSRDCDDATNDVVRGHHCVAPLTSRTR